MEAAAPGQPGHGPSPPGKRCQHAGSRAALVVGVGAPAYSLPLCSACYQPEDAGGGAAAAPAPALSKPASKHEEEQPSHQRALRCCSCWEASCKRHTSSHVARCRRSTQLRLRLRLGSLDALGGDHLQWRRASREVNSSRRWPQAASLVQVQRHAAHAAAHGPHVGLPEHVQPAAQLLLPVHRRPHVRQPTWKPPAVVTGAGSCAWPGCATAAGWPGAAATPPAGPAPLSVTSLAAEKKTG